MIVHVIMILVIAALACTLAVVTNNLKAAHKSMDSMKWIHEEEKKKWDMMRSLDIDYHEESMRNSLLDNRRLQIQLDRAENLNKIMYYLLRDIIFAGSSDNEYKIVKDLGKAHANLSKCGNVDAEEVCYNVEKNEYIDYTDMAVYIMSLVKNKDILANYSKISRQKITMAMNDILDSRHIEEYYFTNIKAEEEIHEPDVNYKWEDKEDSNKEITEEPAEDSIESEFEDYEDDEAYNEGLFGGLKRRIRNIGTVFLPVYEEDYDDYDDDEDYMET